MRLLGRILAFAGLAVAVLIAVAAAAIVYTPGCDSAPEIAQSEDSMLAIASRCYGGPEVLEYASVPKPTIADDELLVKVVAAGVNPLDWHYMRGSPYFIRLFSGIGHPDNWRAGVDFAGIVEAVGKGIKNFQPGDEVFGGRNGAFAEYVVVRESSAVALKPAGVSFEQAAGVGIAGVTALQALRDHGQLQPGQKVLVNGASGGVGSFAVQIAKSMGAEVVGVCSTRNLERVLALGADEVVDYKKSDYTKLPAQYDLIVDMVGNHSAAANHKKLVPGGTLVIVGAPAGDWFGPLQGVFQALVLNPWVDERLVNFTASMRQDDVEALAALMAEGAMTSMIDRRYPLASAAEAIAYSETGRARGKIILEVSSP